MNKKKTIALKDPRLRAIRNNLRQVMSLAVLRECSKHFKTMQKEDRGSTDGYKRYWELYDQQSKLKSSIETSTIWCPTCNFGIDRDMWYNPYDKAWYCVDCFKDMGFLYYVTMARKARGEYIGLDYDEAFVRSFTEDDANIEYEIEKIKKAFQKIDVAPLSLEVELLHAKTRKEVIGNIIKAFFLAQIGEEEKGFGEISHLLAPFIEKLKETGLYEEYQKDLMLVSIEVSGKEFGLIKV